MSGRSRRIAVVTGSRAEYGLLYWVMRDLRDHPDVDLQLIVTGMHLSPEFGMTVREIEADGFEISRRVEMLLSSDSPDGIAKSVALGLVGMSDSLVQLKPDVLLVLGDRFEILAAAQAAMIHNVLIAHIAGGDTTEGAIDESIRHSITKMAHLHLVANDLAARRVRQMGENPAFVRVVGSPGLDTLSRTRLLDRVELEECLGSTLGEFNVLVTFHPVTLESEDGERQHEELPAALAELGGETMVWMTRPNADTGGRCLTAGLDRWAIGRENVRVFTSLGHLRYLSLMAQADAVVGNSSSGLYEAPSLGVPTVNIGDRQRGRLSASSVLHCEPQRGAILACIRKALTMDCTGTVNPYGDGHSSQRIVDALLGLPPKERLLKKKFHFIGA